MARPRKLVSATASVSDWRNLYDICPGVKLADWQSEAWCFKTNPTGGLGRFQHLKNWFALTWPLELREDRWNPWTERTLRELCSDENTHNFGGVRVKVTTLTGNATASKTWTAGMFAFAWFACSPHNSLVAFTSTTKDMIKKRIWPVVQHFYDSAVMEGKALSNPWAGLLNKVESKTTVQFLNPNGTPSDLHAIFALAVADGETQKACHNLRGMHSERVLLIVDELNGTPEAIMKVIPNLRKGCRELQIILIGNPISHLDNHGRACRPAKGGFSAVTETSTEWLTEGVDEWQLEPGLCLRFDGRDSPNVKLGLDRWPFIYTNSDWHHANKESRKKTLAYWQQDRGLWPPDGFSNTIITELMLEIHDPPDGLPFTWKSHKEGCAFLDSAFGGDACKLYLGEFGDIEGGKTGVQITETLEIKFEINEKAETRDYKIARQCMEECKTRGVVSNCFGLDRTGIGRGVAAIMCAEWSEDIVQVEYGGKATDRPSSTADGRPSHEVYCNRVCEMHWSLREFLEAGQLRGIPHQARIELSTREYSMVGRRYKLESKEDFKTRVKTHSPDDGDCATGLVDVVRMRGARAQTGNTTSHDDAIKRELKAAAIAQQYTDYSSANETEELEFVLQVADSSVAETLESW